MPLLLKHHNHGENSLLYHFWRRINYTFISVRYSSQLKRKHGADCHNGKWDDWLGHILLRRIPNSQIDHLHLHVFIDDIFAHACLTKSLEKLKQKFYLNIALFVLFEFTENLSEK